MRSTWWVASVCCLALLGGAGCSTRALQSESAVDASAWALPLLTLPPAALGRSMSEQQLLVVRGPDGAERHLQVLLEVDEHSLRLAVTHMGQVLASLVWDGQRLKVQRSRYLPEQVKLERILSDLQLALWPVEQVTQALPAGWQLQTTPDGTRTLAQGHSEKMQVLQRDSGALEIVYVEEGWSLKIVPLAESSSSAKEVEHR